MDVHGVSSNLHLDPLRIAPAVEAKLEELTKRYEHVVVVYGVCGTGGRLDAVLARYPAVRPAGVHCYEWFAGEAFDEAREDTGTYFLTDWLARNWQRAVVAGLGLDRYPWLKDVYFGHVTRVLYLSQAADAETLAAARRIAAWMRRPLEVLETGLAPLERLLEPLVESEAPMEATGVRA